MEIILIISLIANAFLIYFLNKSDEGRTPEIARHVKIRDEEYRNLLFEYMTKVNDGDAKQAVNDLNAFLIFARSKKFFDRYWSVLLNPGTERALGVAH